MIAKSLIGSTQTLFYNFYDEVTGDLSDIQDPTIRIFDSNRELILESTPIRTDVGKYYYKLLVPNEPPHIYVECTGTIGTSSQCTRDLIECIWSENDINTLPASELTVGTNTYGTLEEANTYFSDSLNSQKWFDLAYTVRIKALITATRRIDSLTFKGKKSIYSQPLSFPRNYSSEEIPPEVKKATFEEALETVGEMLSPDERVKLQKLGVTRVSFGDASETYNGSASTRKLLSQEALNLLKPHIISIVRIER